MTRIGAFRRALDLMLVAVVAAILLALALGRLVPMLGGTTLVVAGPSMGEAVPIGAAVVATPADPESLAVGDVVSLQVGPDHAVFTHRIVRVIDRHGEVWIETKGDANPDPDPAIVPASAVLGRVTIVVPYVGYLLALESAPVGLGFLAGLTVLLICAAWFLETEELDRADAASRPGPGAAGAPPVPAA
ncbi:MAG TPA: signal peptidase I [Candidatus Limnocylindrales bacterium]|jgi:signal peptidase